jgi:hypothetical protein
MIQVTIASQQHRSQNIQKIVDALNEQTVKPDRIAIDFTRLHDKRVF